jgi:hypothetical protein
MNFNELTDAQTERFALSLPLVGPGLRGDQREHQREAQDGTKCLQPNAACSRYS